MADFNDENLNEIFNNWVYGDNNNPADNTSFFGETQEANNQFNSFNSNTATSNGVFSSFGTQQAGSINEVTNTHSAFKPIDRQKAVTKQGLWSKIKSFLFQEIDLTAPIKVELTPYQQKVENEINEFLHQEITFKGIAKFFTGK